MPKYVNIENIDYSHKDKWQIIYEIESLPSVDLDEIKKKIASNILRLYYENGDFEERVKEEYGI